VARYGITGVMGTLAFAGSLALGLGVVGDIAWWLHEDVWKMPVTSPIAADIFYLAAIVSALIGVGRFLITLRPGGHIRP
jgi:hypothetical protein